MCESAHLGIDHEDLMSEVEITDNNVVAPESLMQLDDAQRVELLRICPDLLIYDIEMFISIVLLRLTWS